MKKDYLLIILLIGLFSCQSDLTEDYFPNMQPTEKKVITFIYEGKEYTSEYTYDPNNQKVTLKDPEADMFFQKVIKKPESGTIVNDGGLPEYFDNDDRKRIDEGGHEQDVESIVAVPIYR